MQINIDKEKKELKSHGDFTYPVSISHERIKAYESGVFEWHWHPEIEITLIIDGEMLYQIHDQILHVKKGDAIFGNCNILHSGKVINDILTSPDCNYLSITFHPRILYGQETGLLKTKYVDPICKGKQLPYYYFDNSEKWHKTALSYLWEIEHLSCNSSNTKELEIQILLSEFWLCLYKYFSNQDTILSPYNVKNQKRLQQIIQFIQTNYTEKITLDDIACAANLCKSECCRFFKSQIGETLFHYLLKYRIHQSLQLLTGTELSIAEISEQIGFSSPAYYTRIFRKYMNTSPIEYRKNI